MAIVIISLQNGTENVPLFDGALLKKLDFSSTYARFHPKLSIENPGENLYMRPLCPGDYERGKFYDLKCTVLVCT